MVFELLYSISRHLCKQSVEITTISKRYGRTSGRTEQHGATHVLFTQGQNRSIHQQVRTVQYFILIVPLEISSDDYFLLKTGE